MCSVRRRLIDGCMQATAAVSPQAVVWTELPIASILTELRDPLLCYSCLSESWCLQPACAHPSCAVAACSPICTAQLDPFHPAECKQYPALAAFPDWHLATRLAVLLASSDDATPQEPSLATVTSPCTLLTLEPLDATPVNVPDNFQPILNDLLATLSAGQHTQLAALANETTPSARLATLVSLCHAKVARNSFAVQRLQTEDGDKAMGTETVIQQAIGKALYSCSSMLNHSCQPNAMVT